MEQNQITNLLTILLSVFVVLLFGLIILYIIVSFKNKNRKNEKKAVTKDKKQTNSNNTVLTSRNIYDFMEFEDVQDNMIIQKENFKYIMVVECQGVNYDLMSGVEKTGVEEGFLQFLNTLRHPVQLYIQTRTVNLESSINTYKTRVSEIEAELFKKKQEYMAIKENPDIPKEEKQRAFFSLVKQNNLYEYGMDVIADTERMSLNKNILNKKYYVIIPYYPSELGDNKFDSYEIRNIAFSELYTRAQAIIRTLSACDVKGKILNSKELIELLYVAYNRDHEEDFNLDRALQAQYDKLYSTSEDVYQKKVRELDKKIEDAAIEKAKEKLDIARSEAEKAAIQKQNDMEELINEMAKIVLEANKQYIGKDIADEAIKKVEAESKKAGKRSKKEVKDNAKEEKTRTRRTNS